MPPKNSHTSFGHNTEGFQLRSPQTDAIQKSTSPASPQTYNKNRRLSSAMSQFLFVAFAARFNNPSLVTSRSTAIRSFALQPLARGVGPGRERDIIVQFVIEGGGRPPHRPHRAI